MIKTSDKVSNKAKDDDQALSGEPPSGEPPSGEGRLEKLTPKGRHTLGRLQYHFQRYAVLGDLREVVKNSEADLVAEKKIVSHCEKKNACSAYFLLGECGSGKTTYAYALAYELLVRGLRWDFLNLTFFEFSRIFAEERIKELEKVPILIVDEIGRETMTSTYGIDLLHNVINRRTENHFLRKTTILISNLREKELPRYLEITRLKGYFKLFSFQGNKRK